MATLNIGGKRVKVDDAFLSMTPEQQQTTVDEIAAQMGAQPQASVATAPHTTPPVDNMAPVRGAVAEQGIRNLPFVGPLAGVFMGPSDGPKEGTPQERYDQSLSTMRQKYFPQMDDAQWAEYSQKYLAPLDARGLTNQGLTSSWADEAGGLAGALGGIMDGTFGERYGDFQGLEAARRDLGREQQGALGGAAEFAGGVLSTGPALLKGATQAAGFGQKFVQPAVQNTRVAASPVIEGLKAGATSGAIYGAGAADGTMTDKAWGGATGAAFGGAVGAAAPKVIGKAADMVTNAAQRRATNAAIKGAPSSSELKDVAGPIFNEIRKSGVTVTQPKFSQFADDLLDDINLAGFDPDTTPLAVGIVNRLNKLKGGAPSLADLHILRQIARNASKESAIGTKAITAIDDFVGSLKPADLIGKDAKQKANGLLQAISTWGRARRVEMIEEAIYQAQNAASGVENGLRVQFRALLKPDKRKMFTPAEIQAIEQVASGTSLANVTKLLGSLGFNLGSGSKNVVGGMAGLGLGSFLGPLGPYAVAAGGAASRVASEKLTSMGADRAMRVMATPNIPTVLPKDTRLIDALARQGIRGLNPFALQEK